MYSVKVEDKTVATFDFFEVACRRARDLGDNDTQAFVFKGQKELYRTR